MSLNEDCLLNYLLKPDELAYTTEILKLNNKILEKEFIIKPVFNKIDVSMSVNKRYDFD
ncbi:MAG: hypothetical protein LUB59_02700 [Candidatus Gastranaerophilales bacterium]|nr:hypothetical protein [Candidatus Gastranaerophilales bacterium]